MALSWSGEIKVTLSLTWKDKKSFKCYVSLFNIHESKVTPVCTSVVVISLVRGPGVFGDVLVYWNITPAVVNEFEAVSGSVAMRDGQSTATITLRVCNMK